MAAASNDRSERQAKFFRDILLGKKKVDNVNDFKRFLECLFNQADHGQTVERLIASPNALAAVRNGLRLDITPAFLNEYTSRYIRYLDDPKIKLLCNGQFLKELLLIVVEPRTVWLALMNAFSCRELNADNIYALAWLTAELLQFPRSLGVDVLDDAQTIANDVTISTSLSVDLRTMGHKIKYLLQMKLSGLAISGQGDVAGGRHDNDFFNFREIAILPTSDESACTERPFYRRADEILDMEGDQRVAGHLENQFRLLRADMLLELSANVQIAQGKKKGRQSALRLGNLAIISASCHPTGQRRFSPFSIGVTWKSGLEGLRNMTPGARKTHLTSNTQIIKHKAFGCLLRGEEIVAFASIDRDVELLAHQIPVLKLQISGEDAFRKLLVYLKIYNDIEFLLVDAPIFAYEPILKRLQSMMIVPLKQELILYENGASIENSGLISPIFAERLEKKINADISDLLRTTKPVHLDYSQLCSLLAGLSQNVSIIQGPPGTGKSFIGALLAKAFHDETQEKILVMCYTNHALDQFLEDLLDIGIDASSIVGFTRSRTSWDIINNLENTLIQQETELQQSFNRYKKTDANAAFILSFLEFEDPEYFEALSVPDDEVGMMTIGARGQVVKNDYLYNRWVQGKDAGAFQASLPFSCGAVWKLSNDKRQEKHNIWIRALLEELTESLSTYVSQFNQLQSNLNAVWLERNRAILKSKRIIGCTTTAAAMYFADICQAAPGIVLVEEAGEILESHVLAAMTQETKQLVLIGDHLQLRPKVNSYSLTTEKGDGYDLNVSLFERLIRTGYPHTTLLKQHRMCPEISTLVRDLMYPELEDDDKTKIRPPPRGLQDRVIFIQHNHPEVEFSEISDSRDEGSKQSKRNTFEAELVLKIVKYLGQQGYGTDRLVVLTPYLGQLHLLRDELSKQNDPVLNDLDSYDLVRAGLISKAGTGKTSTARKMGQVYYDMNLITSSEVVEASATDLVGQYIGETGPKTRKILQNALGKVLFIDEAYRLADGKFGQEAMDELVDCLTKPAFFQKLIVVLAGYDDHIVELMSSNPGLTSRFSETLQFHPLSPDYAIQLLTALLMNRKKILEEQGQARFNLGALEEPSNQFLLATTERFGALSHTSGWANARDIESLAKSIFKKALQPEEEENVSVGETEVLEALDELLKDRSSRRRLHMPLSGQETRTNEVPLARIPELLPHPHAYSLSNPSSQVKSGIGENQQTVLSVDGQNCILEEKRDANVSDEIWHQLKYDKAAAVAHEQAFLELLISGAEKKRLIQRLRDLKEEVPLNQDGHDKRLHEQTRLQRETERREQEANLARLQREIETREEERRKEERKQRQLREMGACPVGYRWIKSSNGYRCAGGSHWVSDTDLA
ncbi:P-loop containing nucleoside triphosphate hydrolase protein [Penicillium atrosanguineum]|nr:P-loop containing nucleoside triphosphate hydrolase protein [Penicillium atrosanguineum]